MSTELNLKNFLRESLIAMEASVDYAYPYNNFDEGRAHVALCAVRAKIRIMQKLVENIESKPEIH